MGGAGHIVAALAVDGETECGFLVDEGEAESVEELTGSEELGLTGALAGGDGFVEGLGAVFFKVVGGADCQGERWEEDQFEDHGGDFGW